MDREKVIKGLAVRIQSDSEEWNTIELPIEEANDILVLLKEQEAMMQCINGKCRICPHCDNCDVDKNGLLKEIEPVQSGVDADGVPRCGSCGWVQSYGCNYCDNCGKRLIWE